VVDGTALEPESILRVCDAVVGATVGVDDVVVVGATIGVDDVVVVVDVVGTDVFVVGADTFC